MLLRAFAASLHLIVRPVTIARTSSLASIRKQNEKPGLTASAEDSQAIDRTVRSRGLHPGERDPTGPFRERVERHAAALQGERGYLYTGATLRNVPWIFAYMSDATRLFGQKVSGNAELVKAIAAEVPGAEISSTGRLESKKVPGSKAAYFDLK